MLPLVAEPWVVVGATGKQGGAVVDALLEAGEPVRGLTRDAAKADHLQRRGIEPAVADLDDQDSVERVFAGAAGVFVVTTMSGDGGVTAEVRQGSVAAAAAKAVHVPRVVYSSVGGADRATGIPHFESKWAVEQRMRDLGLPLTVIRPVFFYENLLQPGPQVRDGEVVLAAPLAPDVPLQMVAVRDIGRMAAFALRFPDEIPGGAIEFAGDELTGEAMAAAEGEVRGLPGRFAETPTDGFDDDARTMFSWFRTLPAYRADLSLTRRLLGDVTTYREWAAARP